MELINGNATILRACGAQLKDGSILRSREYILFGHGIATIAPHAAALSCREVLGYNMDFECKRDRRGVVCFEVNVSRPQRSREPWELCVSDATPETSEGIHIIRLCSVEGDPGQYFYLSRIA